MQENEIISTHREFGPKVYRLQTGEYVKVFYPKSGWTKRRWFPKYKTFVENAKRLKLLGFRTISVTRVFHLDDVNADAVQYIPIEGKEFRLVFKTDPARYIEPLMNFIASLHEKGVFFRGMHLGNIVYDDEGQFGIIDMADLSFHGAPLRIDLRIRQLRRVFRYYQDRQIFESLGLSHVISLYVKYAGMQGLRRIIFNLSVLACLNLNP